MSLIGKEMVIWEGTGKKKVGGQKRRGTELDRRR